MGGRRECCSQSVAYDSSKMERILVRFRPIAPKPALDGSVFAAAAVNNNNDVLKGRAKRRYVRHNKNINNIKNTKNTKKRRFCSSSSDSSNSDKRKRIILEEKNSESDRSDGSVLTLSFLPETPETLVKNHNPTIRDVPILYKNSDQTAVIQQHLMMRSSMGSCVIVEIVEGLGSIVDLEKLMDLENDTCPGFISDGYNKAWWTNEAYRKMIGGEVWLVMKEKFSSLYSVFVCRVRLMYTCGKERKSMIVPCDVWRINGGDFAWRLDVQAALSLGR